MKIEEYIEIVKLLQTQGISENIICRILEEFGKDIRTNTMEQGKNKRTGYLDTENTKTNDSSSIETSNQSNKETKLVNPITPGQYKALILMSKDIEGEEYLKSKGIKSEKDIEKLSKKQAWQIMHDRGV